MRHDRAIPIPLTDFEIRSTDKGHQFTGYAAVFGAESVPLPYVETIAPGAFARSLTSPPSGRQTFVVDHDDTKLLSSTQTGRLRLAEDSTGLLVDSEWPDTTYSRDVRELGEARELGGMSFEFSATAKGAPFSADRKKRTIREAKLYHVAVLTGKTPAYGATTAGFRALAMGIDADFEDVVALFDAVHEGRRLSPDEWNLLGRAVAHVAPDGARWSAAASDASSASYSLGSLVSLLGDEPIDSEQAGYLKTAIGALQSYIALDTDKVGTDDDRAKTKPNLTEARALFPKPTTSTSPAN